MYYVTDQLKRKPGRPLTGPKVKPKSAKRAGRPPGKEGRTATMNVNIRPELLKWLNSTTIRMDITRGQLVDALLSYMTSSSEDSIKALLEIRKTANVGTAP